MWTITAPGRFLVVYERRAIPDANQPLSLFQESEQVIRSAKTRGQILIFAGATQGAKIKI
jgi:hypothetical protein